MFTDTAVNEMKNTAKTAQVICVSLYLGNKRLDDPPYPPADADMECFSPTTRMHERHKTISHHRHLCHNNNNYFFYKTTTKTHTTKP